MDKGLMALMGIEDDFARDEGLMERQPQSREPTPFSDEDDDMEPLDITTSTTKSKESRASSHSGSVDTAMTTPVKDSSQEKSQDGNDPLGLFDTAMDDSDDEPLLPSTLTRSLNTRATIQPSPSKPAYTSARRNSPGPLSPHLRPAPGAGTSSLFGSSGSTIRVIKSPKKPKKSNSMGGGGGGGGGSLFSPTLSPRKLKKSASAGFMSPTLSPARKPPSQLPRPQLQTEKRPQPTPQPSASSQDSLSPASPPPPTASAFVLKKAPITFSDDSDSDISSLDGDNIFSRPPQGNPRRIDTETAPSGDGSAGNGSEFTDKEVGADLVQAQVPRRISEKDRVKLRMEAERLKRSLPVSVPEIVNEKKTMSWLLQETQNKLKQKKAPQPSAEDNDLPVARQTPTKKYRTIALDDDSDDETEEQAKWKQDAARALLVAHMPKDQRLKISRDLNSKTISPEKRSEVERILQMTPLSNKIRNMSLVSGATSTSTSTSAATGSTVSATNAKGSSSSSSSSALAFLTSPNKSLTSPSKTQKPGTVNNIHQFNELMKRQLAKKNLERRKQLEEEAKKIGTWKSPEEHAAEQLRIEEKRRKGLDPDEDEDEEEDPDYDPAEGKDTAQPAETVDGDDEMAYASAGESGSDNESAQEEEGDDEDQHSDQEVDASDEESEEEEEQEVESAPEEPEDDEDAPVVKAKRVGARKKTVIGDDDEVRVTVVDRSQVKLSDSEHDDHSDEGGNDDDVSDLDEDMMEGTEEGTQGFGAFFESSYNPNRGNKQEKLAALNRAPSASPTLDDDGGEVTSSIGGALEFLSGGFPSATPRVQATSQIQAQSQSQSQSQEAYGNSPIVDEVDDDEFGNTLPLPSQLNAFDVLKQSATPTPAPATRRRLVQRQAKPARGPISRHDKSAFIEYEAEEEEDEFMGMGGVDYESENDNDDYDLGDGMVDTNNTLDLEDVRNVKALHMKHEQEQHDKEISDLVHGIAAGNLWKRRNGQADDMDIFDEDDINGRFRRKKKLKVSEKFEKLADNPSTAAFARAFEKNIGDDDLIFLSDPEESDHGETGKSGKSKKKEAMVSEDEDADMTPEGQDNEESEEELNTDKRAERLQQARLLRDIGAEIVSEVTVTKTKAAVVPGEEESLEDDNEVDPIDEYKECMRRTKVIRNILDGFDDEVDLALQSMDLPSQRRALPSTFNLLDRIIDKRPMEESASSLRTGGTDVDVTAIARPRMLARQNSSFLSEERRTQFLSTVGEESRGGNAGNRMVKEVNRRKMAFATSKKTTDGGGSSSSSSMSVTTTTATTAISSSTSLSDGKRVPGKVPRLPSDGSSSRLLSLLSFEEEE